MMAIIDQRSNSLFQPGDGDLLRHGAYDQLFHKYIDIELFDFEGSKARRSASGNFEDSDIAIDDLQNKDPLISSPNCQWDGITDSSLAPWAQGQSTKQRDLCHDEESTVFGSHCQDTDKQLQLKPTTSSFSSSPSCASNAVFANPAEFDTRLRSIRSSYRPELHNSTGNKRKPRKSKSNPTMMRTSYHPSYGFRNRWSHHLGERAETPNYHVAMCATSAPHSQAANHLADVRVDASQNFGLGISRFEKVDGFLPSRSPDAHVNNITYVGSEISTPAEDQFNNELYFQNLYIGSEASQATQDTRVPLSSYAVPLTTTYQRSSQWSPENPGEIDFSDDDSVSATPMWTEIHAGDNTSTSQSTYINVMKKCYDPMLSTTSAAETFELYSSGPSFENEKHVRSPPEMSVRHSFCSMREAKRSETLPQMLSTKSTQKPDNSSVGSLGGVSTEYKRRSTSRGQSKSHSRKYSGQSKRALSCGFVNFTASDSERLLSGVAPSGSSKTKARREKEAEEKRRRLSEAATRAIMDAGGDIAVLEENGLLPDYLQMIPKDTF